MTNRGLVFDFIPPPLLAAVYTLETLGGFTFIPADIYFMGKKNQFAVFFDGGR